jgi:small conductance mechanosensitive channel
MNSSYDWTWFLGDPLEILIVLVAAIISRAILIRAVGRVTRHALGSADRGDTRAETVTRLLKSIITGTIWTLALITILAVLGVDVGPILASAGIVGVALGFGAQTLVKDFISGIFLILEDQYGLGDEVTIGTTRGVVDEVALRTTRIRDAEGVLWYIRNGEILTVANHSQNSSWTK